MMRDYIGSGYRKTYTSQSFFFYLNFGGLAVCSSILYEPYNVLNLVKALFLPGLLQYILHGRQWKLAEKKNGYE